MKEFYLQSENKRNTTGLIKEQRPISVRANQSGFSLIEVMVAAFVLGIGILGIVGLQVISLKGTQQSSMRNQATAIVFGLTEKMRTNIDGTLAGKYSLTKSQFDAYNCTTPITSCASNSATCNSDQLAIFDINKVICGYGTNHRTGGIKAISAGDENVLTDGLITIACKAGDCTAGDVSIRVSWTERALDKTETVAQHSDFIEINTRIAQ